MHHTVTDGWSTSVICRELSAAYNAFAQDRTPELPPMPIQYADFAGWQRKWLAAGNMKTQVWPAFHACMRLPSTKSSPCSYAMICQDILLAGPAEHAMVELLVGTVLQQLHVVCWTHCCMNCCKYRGCA